MKKTVLFAVPVVTALFMAASCGKEPVTPLPDNEILHVIKETNALSRFTYDNWREQSSIDIYNKNSRQLDEVNLPWAGITSAAIPPEYKHPEREMQADGTTPRWQLAFNFCDMPTLPGIDMFGLWDSHGQIMRIYTYLEQMPNANAKSCFYQIRSTANCYLDPYTCSWLPDSTTVANCNWGATMGSGLPAPSANSGEILPITGTLDGEVNPGWICFELNFSTGVMKVGAEDNISFSLLGVQNIAFTGHMDLTGTLQSYGGKITIPGNKTKVASGVVNAVGGFFSNLSAAISNGMKTESTAVGVLGGVGAATSRVGGILNAAEEGKDKHYSLDMNFNVSATAEINGSLSSNLGTTVPPTQVDYSVLFDKIISHRGKGTAPATLTMGLWNLKHAPVFYFVEDGKYRVPQPYGLFYDELVTCFLDPTSVELAFNTDNILFPLDEVEKVSLLSYDFIFTDSQYSLPFQPYYDFYGISKGMIDNGFSLPSIVFAKNTEELSDFTLDRETPVSRLRGKLVEDPYYDYGPLTSFPGAGMNVYNLMFQPLLGSLSDVGVSVVLEVQFKNGDSRIFANRFLPEVKVISYRNAKEVLDKIQAAEAPETLAGVPFENPLFEQQKQRVIRLLGPVAEAGELPYRLISWKDFDSPNQDLKYGIVVEEFQNAALMGLIIQTGETLAGSESLPNRNEYLHDVVEGRGDWDVLNARLAKYGMPGLNHDYKYTEAGNYNIQTGECSAITYPNTAYDINYFYFPGPNYYYYINQYK